MIEELDDLDDKLLFGRAQQEQAISDEYSNIQSENGYLRLYDLDSLPTVQNPTTVSLTIRTRKNSKKKNEPFNIVSECQCDKSHITMKHCVVHMLQKGYPKCQ